MLPKDTSQVISLRQIYSFYNTQIISDFHRVRNFIGLKHKGQFVIVSEKLSEIITNVSINNKYSLSFIYHGLI